MLPLCSYAASQHKIESISPFENDLLEQNVVRKQGRDSNSPDSLKIQRDLLHKVILAHDLLPIDLPLGFWVFFPAPDIF